MAIDFDALVLGPCVGVFGQQVVFIPKVSASPLSFVINGVWSVRQRDVILESGGILSTYEPHLGVRLGDFPAPPRQGDAVRIGGFDWAPYLNSLQQPPSLTTTGGTNYDVVDIVIDGQGGADLTLKQTDIP